MYAQNPASNRYFQISESTSTTINSALIMARQRLMVGDGAAVTNSILYLDYSSASSNNYLQITDAGTTISGAVISEGREDNALDIRSNATVTGLAYQYGSATEGQARVDGGSTITGALLARQFRNNQLGPATITYSFASLLSALPSGFPGGVMTDIESWNDE